MKIKECHDCYFQFLAFDGDEADCARKAFKIKAKGEIFLCCKGEVLPFYLKNSFKNIIIIIGNMKLLIPYQL